MYRLLLYTLYIEVISQYLLFESIFLRPLVEYLVNPHLLLDLLLHFLLLPMLTYPKRNEHIEKNMKIKLD